MKPPEIRARLEKSGRSQAQLGAALGKGKDSVSRLVNGKRKLEADEAAKLKVFFGDSEEEKGTDQVPVFGLPADGGEDLFSLSPERVLDYIELPKGLTKGDETIVVRMPSERMSPRVFSGEYLIVAKGVPPTRGGDCLVEFKNGTGMIAAYKGQKEGHIHLGFYNPDKDMAVEATKVRAIHLVNYRRQA